MAIAAKLDELGMAAWIALMILAFIFWWPLGLAILAFLIGSGRMGCMGCWKRRCRPLAQRGAREGGRRNGGGSRHRAAITPSTSTAPRRCGGSKRSSASSASSSTGCASPRTRPSSTSSWPSVVRVRRLRRRPLRRRAEPPVASACVAAVRLERAAVFCWRCLEAARFAPRFIDQERDGVLQRTKNKAQRIGIRNTRMTVSPSSRASATGTCPTASKAPRRAGSRCRWRWDKPEQPECAGEARCRSLIDGVGHGD